MFQRAFFFAFLVRVRALSFHCTQYITEGSVDICQKDHEHRVGIMVATGWFHMGRSIVKNISTCMQVIGKAQASVVTIAGGRKQGVHIYMHILCARNV